MSPLTLYDASCQSDTSSVPIVTKFVAANPGITYEKFKELLLRTFFLIFF
jgi:hypothetical protein